MAGLGFSNWRQELFFPFSFFFPCSFLALFFLLLSLGAVISQLTSAQHDITDSKPNAGADQTHLRQPQASRGNAKWLKSWGAYPAHFDVVLVPNSPTILNSASRRQTTSPWANGQANHEETTPAAPWPDRSSSPPGGREKEVGVGLTPNK